MRRYSLEELENCEAVPKSKKLLRFTLDDGIENERTILSGVHAFYEPEELHNVNGEEKLNLVMLDDAIPAGAKLY